MNRKKVPVLIRSVKPIGFAHRADGEGVVDISITETGTIDEIGSGMTARAGQSVVEGNGAYISPGWIDMHTHVYEAVRAGIAPDVVGPRTGVTRVVDAGSAGEASFAGFRKYVLDSTDFPIDCFLNIGSPGIAPYTRDGINLLRTYECASDNADVIRGIKVLASKKFIGTDWVFPVTAAARLAADLDLPTMVHVAEPPCYIEEIVDTLRAGDIISHCFHGKIGNSIRTGSGRIVDLYHRALEKGIHLDLGHGAASFSYESAVTAIDTDILPTTISTDIHSGNIEGPVGSLAAVMSKMLACGMELERVIKGVTISPASILKRDDYARLQPGARADFTVFTIVEGDYAFHDAGAIDDLTSGSDPRFQKTFNGVRAFRPEWAFWDGWQESADVISLTGGS